MPAGRREDESIHMAGWQQWRPRRGGAVASRGVPERAGQYSHVGWYSRPREQLLVDAIMYAPRAA
ncbi:hypothetical protein J6590_015607 [Homalodisca vitripennis]|nr:hypothetical protein J6590_015607 [Homalodisca vitripennis]